MLFKTSTNFISHLIINRLIGFKLLSLDIVACSYSENLGNVPRFCAVVVPPSFRRCRCNYRRSTSVRVARVEDAAFRHAWAVERNTIDTRSHSHASRYCPSGFEYFTIFGFIGFDLADSGSLASSLRNGTR